MQRLKKVVKKIAAIGVGVAMLGATTTSALALDLADYPAPFVSATGRYNDGTAIVVGRSAAASDTIGIGNIMKGLQFSSKTCVPGGTGRGSVSVSGDAVEISTTGDLLELNESVGDVRETVTEVELEGLKGGIVTTNEGTTEFNQYLRLKELNGSTNTLAKAPVVIFTENDAPVEEVGDFMFVQEGSNPSNAFFEYELEFEDGLESDIVSNKLDDYEDEEIIILGTTYTFVDTKIAIASDSVKLELLGGAAYAVMEEGETRTFTVDGKEYEVEVMIISDVSPSTVTLKINGEVTDQLVDGETEILKDGTLVGISDLILNEAGEAGFGDIVELYIGATKVEFSDTNYLDGESASNLGFSQDVKIDEETIEDAWVQIKGNEISSDEFEIFSIKYRLTADALPGYKDIYVSPGQGIREYLDEPQGMLGLNWDIRYEGLDDTGVSILKFDPSGDDEYTLEFENNLGLVYKIPFVTNEGGTFKYGDNDDDLVIYEGNINEGATDIRNHTFNIGTLDYFILSDMGSAITDDTATTHIVRYNSIDTSDTQLQFDDEATGSRKFVYETTTVKGTLGKAELVFGGNTYRTWIANASTGATVSNVNAGGDNPLAVDQTKDGNINRENTLVTINGGGLLNLTVSQDQIAPTVSFGGVNPQSTFTDGGIVTVSTFAADETFGIWSNTANDTMSSPATLAALDKIDVSLTTLSEDFDENGPATLLGTTPTSAATNEVLRFSILTRTGNRIGIDSASFNATAGPTGDNTAFVLKQPDEDDDNFYGMTDYGVFVNLFDPEGTDNAETLSIEYPLVQRGARVFVTMGDTSATKTTAGEICTVSDITIDTRFDDEFDAASLAGRDAIIVGGPCINEAVGLVDAFPTCDGYRQQYGPGDAILQLAENGDHVALLVAGYDAPDTLAASKRLEKQQSLSGKLQKI